MHFNMSTYFSVYDCKDCRHRVWVGFVGDRNSSRIFCSACHESFTLSPESGESYLKSALPHRLYTRGKIDQVVFSKKGRVKKNKRVEGWVDTGIQVPIDEELRQIGTELYLVYRPIWDNVPCPACQALGPLQDFRDYCKQCPQCGSQDMEESEL
jgi:Zn finger protein HypA/HybF involved in hydrogenase expression